MRALLAFIAAVNPAAVAVAVGPRSSRTLVAAAAAVTFALALVAAAGSEGVLDALDVTPETFRVAAAVVLGLTGARWLVLGPRPVAVDPPTEGWRAVAVPLLIPVLVTPALAVVSISVGADDGAAVAALGAAIALALAWVAAVAGGPPLVWSWAARLIGALGVAVALALAVDGVRSV